MPRISHIYIDKLSIINLTKGYKKMALSKKHFEAIAKMLGENTKANNKLIIEFALYFKSINPNFNKDKFIDAINKSRELKKADEVYYDHKFDLKAKQVIDEANIEDLQKENKILKSKVKTYEQDISNRPEVVYSKSVNFLKKILKDNLVTLSKPLR